MCLGTVSTIGNTAIDRSNTDSAQSMAFIQTQGFALDGIYTSRYVMFHISSLIFDFNSQKLKHLT